MNSAAVKADVGSAGAGILPVQMAVPDVGLGVDVVLRRPRLTDVPSVSRLLDEYARMGLVLPRTQGQLFRQVREFMVAVEGDEVVGCASLRIYTPVLAEICALAVAERCQGRRVGRRLVEALVEEARELGIRRVFALTLQEPFFHRLGFRTVPMEEVPEKIAADRDEGINRAACMKATVVRDL